MILIYAWKDMSLMDFLNEGNTPSNWVELFSENKLLLQEVSNYLSAVEKPIYPEINDVFRAFRIALKDIKVVILGQDPYHNSGAAVGLCFSVGGNVINPSLRNIYTELETEGYNVVKNGDLNHWVQQGCFMLNTALTVEEGKPGSHLEIWKTFMDRVLYTVSSVSNIAWLFMGAKAFEYKHYSERGKAFITSHPSPFSAHKKFRDYPAFLGSNVFKNINGYLESENKGGIRW